MVIEKRYNEIIDRLIEEERNETTAFQRIVYPVVALFVSMIIVAVSKPKIFAETTMIGKTIVIALFIVGVIHLVGRIKDGYDRYTFDEELAAESIFDDNEPKPRPYSRWTATVFLTGGLLFVLRTGLCGWAERRFYRRFDADLVLDRVKTRIPFLSAYNRLFR